VIEDYRKRTGENQGPLDLLTPRQREILQLIAEGRSTKDIADVLQVSVKTVETHRAQLMERLDIHDVAGLVRYAIRTGLITPEH
jgi:DNA-binding NarL/FixJ family response regulator